MACEDAAAETMLTARFPRRDPVHARLASN